MQYLTHQWNIPLIGRWIPNARVGLFKKGGTAMMELIGMGDVIITMLALIICLALVLFVRWERRSFRRNMDERTSALLQQYEDEQRVERLKPTGGIVPLIKPKRR